MWDVGNFLLDPPSEKSDGDHREDEQESNKEESKKEPKVNCLSHLSAPFFAQSQWQKVGKETTNFLQHKLYEILPAERIT